MAARQQSGATKRKMERAAREQIREIEERAEAQHPGVLAMLRAYGGYDETIQRMDAYLDPTMTYALTTSGTGSQH